MASVSAVVGGGRVSGYSGWEGKEKRDVLCVSNRTFGRLLRGQNLDVALKIREPVLLEEKVPPEQDVEFALFGDEEGVGGGAAVALAVPLDVDGAEGGHALAVEGVEVVRGGGRVEVVFVPA